MTQIKNALTPWQNAPAYVVDAGGHPVAEVEFFGDYERDEQIRKRIVACVNACAGMEDPAKEIAALREQNLRFKEELKRMLPVLEADGLYTTGHWIRYIIGEEEL